MLSAILLFAALHISLPIASVGFSPQGFSTRRSVTSPGRTLPSACYSLAPMKTEPSQEKKEEGESDQHQLTHSPEDEEYYAKDTEALQDKALRLLSSELGVRALTGTLETKDTLTPLPLVIIERTLDTVEDAIVHLRRKPYDLGWRAPPSDDRKTVVVLGSGWAAHALLKVADSYKLRIVVVSPTNHFVFTPMLASAAVGTVEYRSMTEAVRASNPMIDQYVEGQALDVDVKKKTVQVQLNSLLDDIAVGNPPVVDIPYDTLVVSVGVRVAGFNVPGAAERCLRLKSCDDARRLRVDVGECFEYASRPDVADNSEESVKERSRRVTFLIVGGGPTGVELAGELSDFMKDITKPRVGAYPKLADSVKVILAHSSSELLPPFEEKLRKEALEAMKRLGVDVRLNTRVVEVAQEYVKLQTKGKEGEEILPVGITIWCAGTSSIPFIDTLRQKLPGAAHGPGGRINVDPWMRVQTEDPDTFGSIMVLGDAACFGEKKVDTAGAPVTVHLPQTAQVAGQQGAYAARILCRGYDLSVTPPTLPRSPIQTKDNVVFDVLLNSWLKLRSLEIAPTFTFLNLGLLAYVGGGQALTQVQLGDVPIASYAGSVAFILWRSVYLVKQVATRNRVLVTFDWVKSSMFGRDLTRL